jgi:hypothetical protein
MKNSFKIALECGYLAPGFLSQLPQGVLEGIIAEDILGGSNDSKALCHP